MNQKQCTVSTETEDLKTYQVVQILKKDLVDESSDASNKYEHGPNFSQNKTKKSIFATLIKRKQTGRPKLKITKKIEACSTIDVLSESTSSDQEIAQYRYSSEIIHNHPAEPKVGKNCNFFKKIIRRSKDRSNPSPVVNKKNACDVQNSCDKRRFSLNKLIPTAYMPKYNIKLITGMNELQDILTNLYQSEQHMVYTIKKYIEDKTVERQLFQASFDYFALQYDSKCQVHVLADKMWYQHLESTKLQDYSLQKRLNYLVKTNRNLESQVESLCRHCEKLAARTNLYPKRFLHMRSFGKVYARQLIENNRKLLRKLNALVGIISDFEEELQRLQHQKEVIEDEKRNLKSQMYNLEMLVDKQKSDYELEKSEIQMKMNHQNDAIKEAAAAARLIFQDLADFEYQMREFNVTITWPALQFQSHCLPEMIYQVRSSVGKLFHAMIATCRNISLLAQDLTKLRQTNARLQENLQKSTYELDNLSKKLEKSSDLDVSTLESQYVKLKQENIKLRSKVETTIEQNFFLKEEVENEKKLLDETKASVNDLMEENRSLSKQIDELVVAMSQLESNKEFGTCHEKGDFLRRRCSQLITDQKNLSEKCKTLDEENQNLLQTQQMYQQDLANLQEGITVLSSENEVIKKQLATEHQTVITLQNERLKYLEEKNLLKTIFQYLKGEVSRIQQLEEAVTTMGKETSRLSLIAEFNKQLGEELKNEVEIKENTISELRQSLEKLSHLQLDSDKEKMTLCARLSEVVTVKDKLSDCLEVELKKNIKLDESKKKLETSTKSQLKIYEEMQKNERAALKELLKDFKNLIKQRDCLLLMVEEYNKKYKSMENNYVEMRTQYEETVAELIKKEEEFKKTTEKMEDQEVQIQRQENNYNQNVSRFEKTIKKLEKLLGQFRNEKNESEKSNDYLKNNFQKLQAELNEARERASAAENKLSLKSTEFSTLESEVNTYRNELQILSQENGKLNLELQYQKKLHEQEIIDLKKTISNFSNKETRFLESQSTMLNKEQQINDLKKTIVEKEAEIGRLEQQCKFLKKQTEDQNKIMIGYENQIVMLQDVEGLKLKLEKELSNAQLEFKGVVCELENSKKENENLRNEMKALISRCEKERTFYKRQTNEIICDYSEQKANIEDEIDNISSQLRLVTENLHSEKHRFDELAKAHEELKVKYFQMKDNLNIETAAHKETCNRLENMENFIKNITTEKDNLQQQIQLLLVEINDEKKANVQISNENKKFQQILEQGKQQFASLANKNSLLEEELEQLKFEMKTMISSKDSSQSEINKTAIKLEEKTSELKSAKETIESLKKELSESQKNVIEFKEEYFKLQQQVTGLEFKNCELTLQLHETQGKLETERNLYRELKSNRKSNTDTATSAI